MHSYPIGMVLTLEWYNREEHHGDCLSHNHLYLSNRDNSDSRDSTKVAQGWCACSFHKEKSVINNVTGERFREGFQIKKRRARHVL